MKNLLLFLSIWMIGWQGLAADDRLTADEEVLKKAADECLSRVSNGKAEDAFNALLKVYWVDKDGYRQTAASFYRQYIQVTSRMEDHLGNPIPGGFELLGVKRLGASFVRLVYLQRNEFFFIPWAFSFYRAGGEWKLTQVAFPDLGADDVRDFLVLVPVKY
jgi:hypothetical protein